MLGGSTILLFVLNRYDAKSSGPAPDDEPVDLVAVGQGPDAKRNRQLGQNHDRIDHRGMMG